MGPAWRWLALVACAALLAARAAAFRPELLSDGRTPRPTRIVRTQQGHLEGLVYEPSGGSGGVGGPSLRRVDVFRGLPYAAPLDRHTRFMPPQSPHPWPNTVLRAVTDPPPCPQPPPPPAALRRPAVRRLLQRMPPPAEDCLKLNVFVPHQGTTASGGSSQENADIQTAETTDEIVDFGSKILATPAVRRLASEEKIDLKNVSGTGRHGRILKEDVLTYLEDRKKTRMHSEETQKSKEFLNVKTSDTLVSSESNVQKKPIQGFAKAMVKTMTAANMIPHFMYSDEINVTKISNIIEELKQIQTPVKFTFMPFFIKAASNSLLKFPLLNSSVDEKCEHILYKTSHNIGVAMDTPAGLVVPNIKNVENLSILEVAQELKRLHHSGLANLLRPSDLTGGTFTLSNIGSIGGKYTLPVVLPPEVAIGGIGAVQIVPRFDELGNVVKAKVICISWAADHRIIDGATIARFSNLWKSYIENPYKLLLNV